MIRLGTLFSGIGAIEQTLLKLNLNHKIIFACDNGERHISINEKEIDYINNVKDIVQRENYVKSLYAKTKKENFMEKSYKANYQINDKDFYQDIRFIDGEIYKGQVDLLVGGSPCQSFSVNGKRGGFADTRGTLFYEYARIIKESQPKCFIFENVKGMLTHDNGRTWETVKNAFSELNYNIYINKDRNGKESSVLNSMDFGMPQNRPRIYIIGIRRDIDNNLFQFPAPIKLKLKVSDFLDESTDPKYYLGKKGFEFVTTHPSRAQVNCNIMRCQKANQQFNWNGDFIFEPLKKITNQKILEKAYIGTFNNEIGVIRKFTPRECLRLMGFPDSFKIVVNDTMLYRQAGNSIVINVLEKIVKEIIKTGVLK